jgi:hypothetical protein
MKQQINQMQQAINFLVDRSQGIAATVPTVPQAGIQEPGPSSRPSSLEKGKGPAPRKSFLDLLISKIAGSSSRPLADDEVDPDMEIVRDAETEELLSILRKMENPVQPSEVPVRLPERLPAPELLPHLTEPKTFWLTKCQLELNSQPIGNAQYNFAVILINKDVKLNQFLFQLFKSQQNYNYCFQINWNLFRPKIRRFTTLCGCTQPIK